MEPWQLLLGVGGVLVPVVIAAMARDRAILTMIQQARSDAVQQAIVVKDDTRKMIDAAIGPIHDRVSRVRDEYVRRDDLDGHLIRWDKQFDELRNEMRRGSENTDKKLEEIRKLLQGRA